VIGDDYVLPSSSSLSDETTTSSTVSGSYYKSHAATSTEPTPDRGAPIDGGGVPCVN
jgi:hypothetical protein